MDSRNINKYMYISHDSLNSYPFESKKFYEIVDQTPYVRLFFQFLKIQNNDEFANVITYLDHISTIFGKYSIAGYCSNRDLCNYTQLPFKPGGKHQIFLSVVFFESCIRTIDLLRISNNNTGVFIDYSLNCWCNPHIYEMNSPRPLIHIMSLNMGSIINLRDPSTQIININGIERHVEEEEWIRVFQRKSYVLPNSKFRIRNKNRILYVSKMVDKFEPSSFMEIDYHNIDCFPFEETPFNEILSGEQYIHFFLDIDMYLIDDMQNIMAFIEKLSTVFGEYSIGGYSNQEYLAKLLGIRFNHKADKGLSLHVVFYTTMISTHDASLIFSEAHFLSVIPLSIDQSLYDFKEVVTFRHVLSNKVVDVNHSIKNTIGMISGGKSPYSQILTIRGDERIVSKEQWSSLFFFRP